ncbi:hypothetical protein mRhiFer1_008491 [Rhinolophus ferrumequinum]|uniref:Uncharacterized protein n=1 Tax=Rhinolophus ferrumequinum TaxID=59479 RepID=A0A7J7UX25_RHIFE|nr:hypothetical protein mRhiFer1_008491 [Rhinolophus ferrumequinum]
MASFHFLPTLSFLSILLGGPYFLETSYSLDFYATTFSSLSFLLYSLSALGTPLLSSSVVRRQSHKPFALCKLLLDDQFTAQVNEQVNSSITCLLSNLFLILSPSWTLGLKPTSQHLGIFCRHINCQNSPHLLLNTQVQSIRPTFSISISRNNSS